MSGRGAQESPARRRLGGGAGEAGRVRDAVGLDSRRRDGDFDDRGRPMDMEGLTREWGDPLVAACVGMWRWTRYAVLDFGLLTLVKDVALFCLVRWLWAWLAGAL